MNDRFKGVGASEAWQMIHEPRKLWKLKTKRVQGPKENELMAFGKHCESFILALYEQENQGFLVKPNSEMVLREDVPLFATVDAYVDDPLEGQGLCEAKLITDWGAHLWQPYPAKYLWQAQQQMLVTGRAWCDLAGLHAGTVTLRTFRLRRDPEIQRRLLEGIRMFWEYVRQDRPPPEGELW